MRFLAILLSAGLIAPSAESVPAGTRAPATDFSNVLAKEAFAPRHGIWRLKVKTPVNDFFSTATVLDHLIGHIPQVAHRMAHEQPLKQVMQNAMLEEICSVSKELIPAVDSLLALPSRLSAQGFQMNRFHISPDDYHTTEILLDKYVSSGQWQHISFQRKKRDAGILFQFFLRQHLAYLSHRIWDDGDSHAQTHYDRIKEMLKKLNGTESRSGKGLVNEAGYLFLIAVCLPTKIERLYFELYQRIDSTLKASDRFRIHMAQAKLNSDHYRENIIHDQTKAGKEFDPRVETRNINSIDVVMMAFSLAGLWDNPVEKTAALLRERLETTLGTIASDDLYLTAEDLMAFCHSAFLRVPGLTTEVLSYIRNRQAAYSALLPTMAAELRKNFISLDPNKKQFSPLGKSSKGVYCHVDLFLMDMTLRKLMNPASALFSLENALSSSMSQKRRTWAEEPASGPNLPSLLFRQTPWHSREIANYFYQQARAA